jgi:hypothetical protein
VIGAAAAVVIAVVIIAVVVSWSSGPSDEAIDQAIKPQNGYLFKSDGSPRFDIVKVDSPQTGWYIASIKLRDVETETNQVILHQDDPPDGPLTLVIGPGTAFPPPSYPTPDPLPSAVRHALLGGN